VSKIKHREVENAATAVVIEQQRTLDRYLAQGEAVEDQRNLVSAIAAVTRDGRVCEKIRFTDTGTAMFA
jgi:uncharacterized protein YjhX (UPF0386 family)